MNQAHTWHKNGDHPQDYSKVHYGLDKGEMREFPPEERKANGWEGDVVRYYRHPDVPGDTVCEKCGQIMHNHGWIDQGANGITVCPGSKIATKADGTYEVVS